MLVAVGGLKAAPGVTTTALALGAVWPGPSRVVVAECDPGGGDLAAWYGLKAEPGLVSLAAASRRGGGLELLAEHCQQLPGGLDVVVGAVADDQATSALGLLGGGLLAGAAEDAGLVVVADCGRLHPGTPAAGVLAAAGLLLVVCRPLPAELAHLASALRRLRGLARRVGLVLVGEGPYKPGEITAALQAQVVGVLPLDRRAAGVLAGSAARSWALRRTPLLRAARAVAEVIQSRVAAGPMSSLAAAAGWADSTAGQAPTGQQAGSARQGGRR